MYISHTQNKGLIYYPHQTVSTPLCHSIKPQRNLKRFGPAISMPAKSDPNPPIRETIPAIILILAFRGYILSIGHWQLRAEALKHINGMLSPMFIFKGLLKMTRRTRKQIKSLWL